MLHCLKALGTELTMWILRHPNSILLNNGNFLVIWSLPLLHLPISHWHDEGLGSHTVCTRSRALLHTMFHRLPFYILSKVAGVSSAWTFRILCYKPHSFSVSSPQLQFQPPRSLTMFAAKVSAPAVQLPLLSWFPCISVCPFLSCYPSEAQW